MTTIGSRGVCALGTHPVHSLEQLRSKVGEGAFSRLKGRLFSHSSPSPGNVIMGKTNRGTLAEINPHDVLADMVIGIGEGIADYLGWIRCGIEESERAPDRYVRGHVRAPSRSL